MAGSKIAGGVKLKTSQRKRGLHVYIPFFIGKATALLPNLFMVEGEIQFGVRIWSGRPVFILREIFGPKDHRGEPSWSQVSWKILLLVFSSYDIVQVLYIYVPDILKLLKMRRGFRCFKSGVYRLDVRLRVGYSRLPVVVHGNMYLYIYIAMVTVGLQAFNSVSHLLEARLLHDTYALNHACPHYGEGARTH